MIIQEDFLTRETVKPRLANIMEPASVCKVGKGVFYHVHDIKQPSAKSGTKMDPTRKAKQRQTKNNMAAICQRKTQRSRNKGKGQAKWQKTGRDGGPLWGPDMPPG